MYSDRLVADVRFVTAVWAEARNIGPEASQERFEDRLRKCFDLGGRCVLGFLDLALWQQLGDATLGS